MKDIPDKSIDMILCDLPYGNFTACKWDVVIPFNKYVQIGKKVIYEQEYVFDKMKSGASYKEALEDFLSISKDGLWEQYKRIIKPNGAIVLTASQPFTSALVMSNIKDFRYEIIWEKERPTNIFFLKKQIAKYHENIVVFYKKQPTYNPQMEKRQGSHTQKEKEYDLTKCNNNGSKTHPKQIYSYSKDYNPELVYPKSVLKINRDRQKDAHPTQKPVALLEYLIKTYTLEGETVLDNCMGSGSTGVACKNLNRNFIGIELDPEYFKIAEKRINENL